MSKLKDYCKIIPGYAFKSSDFNNGNSKVIKIADIEEHINCSQLGTVSSTGKDIDKYKVQNGDFVMSMTSATQIGKIGIVENVIVDTYINQRLCKFSDFSNEVEPLYIYYAITQPQFNKFIRDSADSKTLQQNISHNTIGEYPIVLPDITTQKRIASILKSIDDKISNNNRINAELESMAKTIYDYWFTQFDFPDENGKPYKSSGGKMVWNEELKREIPEGWGDTTLNRYIGRITNGLNPRKNFVLGSGENYYVTIKSLTGNDINWEACDRCDDVALSKINARSQLQVGDVIFSAIGTIGRTFYIQDPPTNWNISEASFTVRPNKDVPTDFFYALLNNDEIQMQADKKAMGSTLRCLVMDSFTAIPYIEIPCTIMQKFANIVRPMYDAIYKNNKQNRELASLRDWLLPMLMNGQVGFEGVE